MGERRLVVTGDDLGRDRPGTATLCALWEEGLLTAASMITVGEEAERVAARLRAAGLTPRLHLTLTSERGLPPWRPLTGGASLRDADGRMPADARRLGDAIDLDEVREEFDAQLGWMHAHGLHPRGAEFHTAGLYALRGRIADMVHVFLHEPAIAGNTGNAIRLAAVTGARLHLIEPLGFDLEDAKLRRAGLDYHDLADVSIHPDLEHALAAVPGARVFAFTARTETTFGRIEYRREDVLLFGTEPTGLPEEVMDHPRITARVRIPMLPARRSLNLANSVSIAVYEAWRQHGYDGAGA